MQDTKELGQAITWLDQQRKLDRELLEKLQQQIEHFSLLLKDVVPQMERLDGESRQAATVRGRIGRLEEQGRQEQEQISDIAERIQAQEQNLERFSQQHQAELDREHKSLAEILLQVNELFRREEGIRNQLTAVVDENKRQTTSLATLGIRTDHVEHDYSGLSQRLLGYDDFRKRVEPELQSMHRTLEIVQADFGRLQQWQQATDLKWSRETSAWQEKMDEWTRLIEDQTKAIQQVMRDIAIIRANFEQIEAQVLEQTEQTQNALVDVRRLESGIEIERQEIARLVTAMDVVRKRIDDQVGQMRQQDEKSSHLSSELRDLGGRTDDSRKRIEEQGLRVGQIEQRQRERADDVAGLASQLTALRFEIEGVLRRLEETIQQNRQWQIEQATQRQRLIERQLRREVSEVEQQLREAKELYPRSADGATETT
jgi:chromosome segregation ATPase